MRQLKPDEGSYLRKGLGITFHFVRDYFDGGPGLVVMGGDSCSEGHRFESWHRILDGLFSH